MPGAGKGGKMAKLTKVMMALGAFAICGVAVAQSLVAPAVTTAISGKGPTTDSFIKEPSTGMALQSIQFGEDSDDPCFFKMSYRHVKTGAVSTQTYDRCDGKSPGDLRLVKLPDGAHVTGARICLNSDGNKIKGVQLIGGYQGCVLGAASVTVTPNECSQVKNYSGVDYRLCSTGDPKPITISCSTPITAFYERPNCKGSDGPPDSDWSAVVSCGPRTVATGVKLRSIAGSGDRKMASGLALTCARIAG